MHKVKKIECLSSSYLWWGKERVLVQLKKKKKIVTYSEHVRYRKTICPNFVITYIGTDMIEHPCRWPPQFCINFSYCLCVHKFHPPNLAETTYIFRQFNSFQGWIYWSGSVVANGVVTWSMVHATVRGWETCKLFRKIDDECRQHCEL